MSQVQSNKNHTEEEQISGLYERVKILEEQVSSCLRFMKYYAEKEAEKLERSFPAKPQFIAKA